MMKGVIFSTSRIKNQVPTKVEKKRRLSPLSPFIIGISIGGE